MYENVLILELVQKGFSIYPIKSILIISMQLKFKRELYVLTSILIYETNQHTPLLNQSLKMDIRWTFHFIQV